MIFIQTSSNGSYLFLIDGISQIITGAPEFLVEDINEIIESLSSGITTEGGDQITTENDDPLIIE